MRHKTVWTPSMPIQPIHPAALESLPHPEIFFTLTN